MATAALAEAVEPEASTAMTDREFAELRYLVHWAWTRQREVARENRRLASCAGKHAWESRPDAEASISVKLRKQVLAYRCNICRKWHIGENTVSRKKRITYLRLHRYGE